MRDGEDWEGAVHCTSALPPNPLPLLLWVAKEVERMLVKVVLGLLSPAAQPHPTSKVLAAESVLEGGIVQVMGVPPLAPAKRGAQDTEEGAGKTRKLGCWSPPPATSPPLTAGNGKAGGVNTSGDSVAKMYTAPEVPTPEKFAGREQPGGPPTEPLALMAVTAIQASPLEEEDKGGE